MCENQYSYSACVVEHALVNELRQLPWQLWFSKVGGYARPNVFRFKKFPSWKLFSKVCGYSICGYKQIRMRVNKGYKDISLVRLANKWQQTWGRSYERWITYPANTSYSIDKSLISRIVIRWVKVRCTRHGRTVNTYIRWLTSILTGKTEFS